MAHGHSKQTLSAMWNSIEEPEIQDRNDVSVQSGNNLHSVNRSRRRRGRSVPKNPRSIQSPFCEHHYSGLNSEHYDSDHNIQQQNVYHQSMESLQSVHRSHRDIPKNNRSTQGTFGKHHCSAFNSGHCDSDHNIQQQKTGIKKNHPKSQRQHRSQSMSVLRNPGCTLNSPHEFKQDQNSSDVYEPRKSYRKQSNYVGKHNVEQSMTVRQTKGHHPSSRDGSFQHVTGDAENSYNSASRNKASIQGIPRKASEYKENKMSFTRLRNLVVKDADEILLNLINPRSGFLKLIELPDISHEMMSLVLIVLGKACKSKLRDNLFALINIITSNSNFMFFSLQKYFVYFPNHHSDDMSLDSLHYLVEFLKTFVDSQPATASQTMCILSPIILKTVQKCGERNSSQLDSVSEALNALIEQTELFIKQHTQKEIVQVTAEEKLQLQKPPDDFHEIPILPKEHDIYDYQPFLRPNVVAGKYLDVNHYLDVQFRLLREDFVRPLREGIAEYKMLKNKEQAKRCKDLRVYLNVHIVGSEFVNGTLIYLLQFDVDSFKNVSWEYSKRFLTGSLLCLSTDSFQTMLFATVIRRDVQKLGKGLLMIKFEELTDEVLNITPLLNFVVLETEAYFEAYRHILVALQSIALLPLEKYIVQVEKNINPPQYLSQYTTYDISPLLLPVDMSNLDDCDPDKSGPQNQGDIENRLKSLPILDNSHWPNETELGLDVSQYNALKAALTKEFSVIQGPPGTGKTYIGLRVVQLLLHNSSQWNTSKAPILVVCYTNHALDQFLEGILNFTQKIVRIGGRCISEKVEPYHISNLRSKVRMERNIPGHIFSNIKEKTMVLKDLQRDVNETESLIQKGSKTILSEEILKPCMKSTHYTSLKRSLAHFQENSPYSIPDDGLLIYDWLEIRFRGFETENLETDFLDIVESSIPSNTPLELNNAQDAPNESRTDDDLSSEGEGDVDFIEAMRDMDDEDFSSVNFNFDEEIDVGDLQIAGGDGQWKTQGGAKKRKQFVQRMLKNTDVMTSAEADGIVDIWTLVIPDRWRLYRFWLNSYVTAQQENINETQQKVRQEYRQLCEMKLAEDLHVMHGLEVVGMTTTGAAKYRNILQTLDPHVVIVEEAAEILESHIITSLAPSTEHVILIGDHQQLRPSPTVFQLATKYHLDISLFERMINNSLESHVLSIQHRMRPSIAALLVPHIYADLKNDESVLNYEDIKGVCSNVFFLSHTQCEGKASDSASKVNFHEASFLVEFCRYLLLQGYAASQITILTAYSGQLIILKKLMKNALYKGVRITVIDNFQGEENDIILISFVRSNDDGLIGFLKTSNRVCVALSRAKKGLFCIGNFTLLAEKSKLWRDLMSTLETQNAVGDALELSCQNHPKTFSFVTTAKDFKSVPEGGCTRPCEYRLECGHTCTRMCHPYDPGHEMFQCRKECGKVVCQKDHRCPKMCYQECGMCCVKVFKSIPSCKHEVLVPCHLDPIHFKCTSPCIKKLLCGHLCAAICGERCTVNCLKETVVSSPCGHTVRIKCYRSDSVQYILQTCQEKCNTELDCGHLCEGTCSQCSQGRLHLPCKSPCKRVLICGHTCMSECSQSCPPCRKKCENRCVHSKCPKPCGVPCKPCKEKCEWKCAHKQCTKLCCEPCNRTPCDIPCPNLLPCKHPCVGLCGEPCPRQCAFCNNQKLKEVFFGTEDEEGARFIRLEDCNHVFEVSGLTQWMNLESGKAGEIQMKCCPKCKTVIRRNLRFGQIIKACLNDVEKVKSHVFGEMQQIQHRKVELLARVEADVYLENYLTQSVTYILGQRNVSILEIERCENVINLATALQELLRKKRINVSSLLHGIELKNLLSQDDVKSCLVGVDALNGCICEAVVLINRFLQNDHVTATLQQLKEIAGELQRLKLLTTLWQILRTKTLRIEANPQVRDIFSRTLEHIISIRYHRFTSSAEEKLNKNVELLTKMCGGAMLGISDHERKLILSAMSLRSGHWYQCPNGHVYCITECGGAVTTGKCNECGATIGGQRHSLRSDNRVATDMDGARRDAWTIAANAENYNLNDLL